MLKEIRIEKYRGFKQVSFTLGSHLTVIAGQNGTQKTTLLGMLTQMFTLDPWTGGTGHRFTLRSVRDKN